MRKLLSVFIKLNVSVIIAGCLYFAGVLIINTIWDYKPQNQILISDTTHAAVQSIDKKYYSALSWNIGYGGLGDGADFFYDGGAMARPDKIDFNHYYQGILDKITSFDSLDFILLQEVDTASSRSYYTKQFADISHILPSHNGLFAKNYDVYHVPFPVFLPMGRVVSGLALFSGIAPEKAALISFPDNYSWPKKLFMPDRCYISATYSLPSGKKLSLRTKCPQVSNGPE